MSTSAVGPACTSGRSPASDDGVDANQPRDFLSAESRSSCDTARAARASSLAGVLGLLVREISIQVWHTLRGVAKTPSHEPSDKEFGKEICQLSSRLGYSLYFVDSVLALATHFRHMNMVERLGDPAELAQAYSNHAPGIGSGQSVVPAH